MSDPTQNAAILSHLERSYDAIPRVGGARVEAVGPFELFLRTGPGWPYYARPRLGTAQVTAVDVASVLARQRALGVPEAIEWVDDVTPALLPVVRQAGLSVVLAPLMVLDSALLPNDNGAAVLLDPSAEDFADACAQSIAVAGLAFGPTGTSPAGTPERDELAKPVGQDRLAQIAAGLRAGHKAEVVLSLAGEGIVARGALQSALGAAEVVGVATLPAFQRRGYGAAVSTLLARVALDRGNSVVFLSAASEDVARVYARIGFRRIGTAVIAEADGSH
jgi:ribosomal protein S18 acetylase RimI-like enzyme